MHRSRALRESRAMYDRTWQNVVHNGGGGLLRNAPPGFPTEGPSPSRVWRGSDRLASYGFGGFDDGGYWTGNEGGYVTVDRTWSGQPATLPAVGRATNLIVDTISGLPWWLVRDRDRLPLPAWLADPQNRRGDPRFGGAVSDGASAVAWRTALLISMLWYGDGFIYTPNRGTDGAPLPPVFVLDPWDIDSVGPGSSDSRPVGHYVTGTSDRIPDDLLVHLRGEGPYDENGRGLGVLARYAASYGLLGQIGAYSDGMYGSGVPSGYLKVASPNISPEQAETLRASWMDKHAGRARGVAVLNSITEFTPLSFSPVDAALIESKKLSMLDIALAFGVPPYMLGLPAADSTYANVESRMLEFSQFTLLPWCRRVESGLDSEFALGTGLKVDLRGLLRADQAVRVSAYHYGITDGWLTVDEVRDLEDLPPMTASQRRETAPAPLPAQLVPVPTEATA